MPEEVITKSSTTIVNIKHTNVYDFYCGRGSPFGNPYIIGRDGTRNEVCDKFIPYFNKRLKDPYFRAQVMELKGKRLACFCVPLRCHLETIVDYINK